MDCQKVFGKIDELNERYVDIWEDICNLESPTADKERVDAVGAYFIKMAQDRGWKIETQEHEKGGNSICFTMNPEVNAAPVSISGHIDTVHPVGLFPTPAVHRDAEKIYGPGVIDCKGGVLSGFLAMDALFQCGFTDRPVKLIIQPDEETSSRQSEKKSIEFMCRMAAGSAVFLNAEGMKKNRAVLSRKGISRYLFTITGKAAHSSKCQDGISAIAEAAHIILELEKYKDEKTITCNCGVIQGGTVPNSVAAHCEFFADFRFVSDGDLKRIEEHVKNLCASSHLPGCKVSAKQYSFRPAMEHNPRNVDILEKMNQIYESLGMPRLEGVAETGGSDAAYTTLAGIPTVDSLGMEGGRAHSVEEFAYISSLAEAAKRHAAVAMYI